MANWYKRIGQLGRKQRWALALMVLLLETVQEDGEESALILRQVFDLLCEEARISG